MEPIFSASPDATWGHVFKVICFDLQLHADYILLIGLRQIAATTCGEVFGCALCSFVIDVNNLAFTSTVYRGGVVDAARCIDYFGGAFLQQTKEHLSSSVILYSDVMTIVDTTDDHVIQCISTECGLLFHSQFWFALMDISCLECFCLIGYGYLILSKDNKSN